MITFDDSTSKSLEPCMKFPSVFIENNKFNRKNNETNFLIKCL